MFVSALNNVDWTALYSTVGKPVFMGIAMSLVDMIPFFIILLLISIVVSIMSLITSRRTSKFIEKNSVAQPANPVQPIQLSAPSAYQTGLDPAVVAAITAAVSVMLTAEGQQPSTAGFRIRQIRRV